MKNWTLSLRNFSDLLRQFATGGLRQSDAAFQRTKKLTLAEAAAADDGKEPMMLFGWRRALRQLQEDLDARLRQRDLEYEELLDKVHRWMQKTSARAKRVAEAEEAEAAEADPLAHLDPVSRAIHERRRKQARP